MKIQTDFEVRNCFSLLLLYPITQRAFAWVDANVWLENWQSQGRIAIEPRYFDDLYEGIKDAGLTIEKT